MTVRECTCTCIVPSTVRRDLLATVVTIPELDGTFIELETMTDAGGVDAALADVRSVLGWLGIYSEDLTNEQYTEAVLASRHDRAQ